jgi:hypothetical protein
VRDVLVRRGERAVPSQPRATVRDVDQRKLLSRLARGALANVFVRLVERYDLRLESEL